jgi:hypothetical protein
MNASFTFTEMAVEPARPDLAAGTPAGNTPATQRPQEGGRISSEELAQKVLKLTGNVRLSSRSAHHWHHCGINE